MVKCLWKGQQEKRLVGKGSFYGELALVQKRESRAKVICHTDCDIIYLKNSDFAELLKSHGDLRGNYRICSEKSK